LTITIDPKAEEWLRERADAVGLSIAAYIERLANADQSAATELEELALEGLNSGHAIEIGLVTGKRNTAVWRSAR